MSDLKPAAPRPLPVIPGPAKIRPSRMSRWRAFVLILVHVLIAIHISHWWYAKRTISPLEPSEGMQFAQRGVINAGFVFFALAILSTLVLGRFFCGWGCHLVALQDLSRWLLRRIGIRPKPIRSAVLALVPMLAFLYMFVAPALAPLALRLLGTETPHAESWKYAGMEMSTTEFWKTFPSVQSVVGVTSIVLTLLVVGLVIIYVLGAKGFCVTSCPYGAIFGAADRLAPLRIRVNDDCTGSGHCTAVCTSNVRVHEEVRDFGTVVDPGCMKCLDCVSVCPNEALSVAWGPPGFAVPRTPRAKPEAGPQRSGWAVGVLLVCFAYSAVVLFHGFDIPARYGLAAHDWVLCGIVAAIGLAASWIFRTRARRPRECSLAEEFLLAVFFLLFMFAFRGLNGLVPYLAALAIAAVGGWLLTQAVLLLGRRQLSVHGFRLKHLGRLQPAAAGFLAIVVCLIALGIFSGAMQVKAMVTGRMKLDLSAKMQRVLQSDDASLLAATIDLQRDILVREPRSLDHTLNLGYLLTRAERLDEAQKLYEEAERDPRAAKSGPLQYHFGMLDAIRGRPESALARFRKAVELDPDSPEARLTLANALVLDGRIPEGLDHYQQAADRFADNVDVQLAAGGAALQLGDIPLARRLLERAAALDGNREDVRYAISVLNSLPSQGQPKP
ncbi:MAG: tetratricopeptide repeat protein [Planctomycetes bacterium]|nr:tetratricopeptide repeat protein [Planctomycetota bacterium]